MKPQDAGRQSVASAFRNAFVGIGDFARERNSRIQLIAAAVACGLAAWLRISATEWAVLAVTIGGVLGIEALNCAVERVVDLASPGQHELARQAKDLAAGAVLIVAVGATVVGAILFVPRLIALARLSG
jgi:diacylglycerol kinase